MATAIAQRRMHFSLLREAIEVAKLTESDKVVISLETAKWADRETTKTHRTLNSLIKACEQHLAILHE